MKNRIQVLSMVLLIAAFVFVSCGGGGGSSGSGGNVVNNVNLTSSELIGTWVDSDSADSVTFKNNGTLHAIMDDCTFDGNYSVFGSVISITVTTTNCSDINVGDTSQVLFKIKGNRMYSVGEDSYILSADKLYPFGRVSGSPGLTGKWEMLVGNSLESPDATIRWIFDANGNFRYQEEYFSASSWNCERSGTYTLPGGGELTLTVTSSNCGNMGNFEGAFWIDATGNNMNITIGYMVKQ